MKIALIGSGGREHALIKKIKENPSVEIIYALPGNGGIALDAECVPIAATDIETIKDFCIEKSVDYVVVAPDNPLVMGLVNLLEDKEIPCFGPRSEAAIIEGSKVFAKNLMKKYGIPTAECEVFNDADRAKEYIKTCRIPVVIKADGLALGKGVIIAETREEAVNAINSMMLDKVFGESGTNVVIEEYLEGPEVSVLSFTDGKTLIPMVSSMDHKRAGDNDTGLNTGGMGAVAPNPYYTDEIAAECMEKIFLPTVNAMNKEGRTFKGCLYFGLMLTKDGPKVIEYNCRFGDPETQVVLPLLKTDLLSVMQAVSSGRLSEIDVEFKKDFAACVVVASEGYPEKYEKGFELTIPEEAADHVYIAGAKKSDGVLLTDGGRVAGCCAQSDNLEDAIRNAYEVADKVKFKNKYSRSDIGQSALKAYREK